MNHILKKGLFLLLKQQTSILSAAYIIMATVIFSQLLGLVRNRLLVSIFGASNTLGIYNFALILPDTVFQLIIASAYASAFIPIFSSYLRDKSKEQAHELASSVLMLGISFFSVLSLVLIIFAPFFLKLFNLGSNFSTEQMILMTNLMRLILIGQLFFVIGTSFTAILQSYNHFFIPGIAAAMYNLGNIIGIYFLSQYFGIYSTAIATTIGGAMYVAIQIPMLKKIGFSFRPTKNLFSEGVKKIIKMMMPRTTQNAVQQIGTLALAAIIGLMTDPGRMNLLFDYAKILMFAPVSLIGFSIAQASFPILSRESNDLKNFKKTFVSSAYQILYLILPISVLILVLRIPIVRLIYGADRFDWEATLLTGRTLAYFSISIFAQALIGLCYRAFYSLHNSSIPLFTSIVGTFSLIIFAYIFGVYQRGSIESIAYAFSLANFIQLLLLLLILNQKTHGFDLKEILTSSLKLFIATTVMAIALYIPIKLLDELVIDTTRTVGLILITGISCTAGIMLYLFCTWLLNIKEAHAYLGMLKKLGNWKEILSRSEEVINPPRT